MIDKSRNYKSDLLEKKINKSWLFIREFKDFINN